MVGNIQSSLSPEMPNTAFHVCMGESCVYELIMSRTRAQISSKNRQESDEQRTSGEDSLKMGPNAVSGMRCSAMSPYTDLQVG